MKKPANNPLGTMTVNPSETPINKPPEAKHSEERAFDTPLDSPLLGQVLLELNIARKNFAIYPLGHSQIAISIDKAYGLLTQLMCSRSELIIGAATDRIVTDNDRIEFSSPVHRELSQALHSLNIAAVCFINGLTKKEVFDFLDVITRSLEDREGRSDISLEMNEAGIEHISIESIDYDRFYLTEKTQIDASESSRTLKPSDIWHEFVGNIFSERRLDPARRDRFVRMQPSELADEINNGQLDPAFVLQNYQRVFTDASLPAIQNQLDLRLDTLLKNLNPELRQQFLSITLDQISKGSEGIMDCISSEMVFEMLQQANAQNRQLSPSLFTLLEKMSHSLSQKPLNPEKFAIIKPDVDSPAVKEHLQKVLDREPYENYVDPAYGSMLHGLSRRSFQSGQLHRTAASDRPLTDKDQPLTADDSTTVSDPYLEEFDPRYLDLRIADVSLALLDLDLSVEDYTVLAETLVMKSGHFIDINAYDVVLEITRIFHRHSLNKTDECRNVAEVCLQKLTASDISTKVLQVLEDGSHDHVGVASEILSFIGKSAISKIIDHYIAAASSAGNRKVFLLLQSLGADALEEAYRHLQNPRILVVRKMLALIRKIGSNASIDHVRPFIRHGDPLVRLDALTALLHFQDKEAPDFLRRFFRSIDQQECMGAIQLSGYYRVKEVIQDLSDLLIKSPWRRVDYLKNTAIIKSLGKTGDPCVLPVLERLIGKSLAIYPDELRAMKVAVFESLSGYPRQSLSRILIMGKASDDYRIRDICRALS